MATTSAGRSASGRRAARVRGTGDRATGGMGRQGMASRVLMRPVGRLFGPPVTRRTESAARWAVLQRAGFRATYLRVAPGTVQVIVYPYPWRKSPAIREYPIESGTLVLAREWLHGTELTLVRGTQTDVVTFSVLAKPTTALERVWQALLSTAPRPALSATELVG